jgi:pimeloyl-ACP methyl ester carboxylesterase
VCPSLPGFGFSDKPSEPGWGIERMAGAFAELMTRLGYERFAAQGGDMGALITRVLALREPKRVLGLHLSTPYRNPDADDVADSDEDRAAFELAERWSAEHDAYFHQQRTRPQTVGYGLVDSPAAQAAWILEKFWEWADFKTDLSEIFSKDQLLDIVMMYWLPGAGASSARTYSEFFGQPLDVAGQKVTVPVGMSIFPGELVRLSRRWVERDFTDVRYWNELERGGHFGAYEQPVDFVNEIRACFRAIGAPATHADHARGV